MHAFQKLLKNYRLDDLLLLIGTLGREMFNSNEAVRFIPAEMTKKTGTLLGIKQEKVRGSITISAWGLIEIAYHAVLNTHDFAREAPNFDDLLEICNEYLDFENSQTGIVYQSDPSPKRLFLDLFGLAQKEFWFQQLHLIREQFNRDVEMLEHIPKVVKGDIDLDAIVKRITGFSIHTFRKILLSIFAMGAINSDISAMRVETSIAAVDKNLTRENIIKVAASYGCEYQDIRVSRLKHMFFYVKPIVHSTRNRYLIANQFLIAKKIADGIYWKLRDYYLTKNSNDNRAFTKYFGECFEEYVRRLFVRYLEDGQYLRVPEDTEERADWIVYSKHYQLVVEQKSTLMSLLTRDLHVELALYDEYFSKLKRGISQLDKTAAAYSTAERTTIEILLFYDHIFMAENILKDQLISYLFPGENHRERLLFLVTISDFELLMQILHEDNDLFDTIIQEKIDLENSESAEGRDFDQVIRKHYEKNNAYINVHLNHYEEYLNA